MVYCFKKCSVHREMTGDSVKSPRRHGCSSALSFSCTLTDGTTLSSVVSCRTGASGVSPFLNTSDKTGTGWVASDTTASSASSRGFTLSASLAAKSAATTAAISANDWRPVFSSFSDSCSWAARAFCIAAFTSSRLRTRVFSALSASCRRFSLYNTSPSAPTIRPSFVK